MRWALLLTVPLFATFALWFTTWAERRLIVEAIAPPLALNPAEEPREP